MEKSIRTRKRIVEESSKIFIAKGIASTSMEDVARKTGCHRRTLYRYFPQKEDLLFEIVMEMIARINAYQNILVEHLEGSGLEKFSSFLRGLIDFMTKNRDMVRFLGEFDYQYNDRSRIDYRYGNSADFLSAAHETEAVLEKIIESGISDKTIGLAHDSTLFVSTVTTMLWSAAQKAAMRGELLEGEYGMTLLDMVNCQIDLYVIALRR